MHNLIIFILPVVLLFGAIHFALAAPDLWGGQYNTIEGQLGLGTGDPRIIAANVIRIVLGFLGVIALGLILYGGWIWMTSHGQADKIEKAKKILISAVIGLLIIISAFGIATFMLNKLIDATGGNVGNVGTCDSLCGLGLCCVSGACQACPAGGPGIFYIKGQSPVGNSVSRNVKVKFTFSADVDSTTVNNTTFRITNGGGDIAGAILVEGNRVIFTPDAACPPNPCNAAKCFAANDTITVKAVNGASGILSAGGKDITCGGLFKDCQITFTTGDFVDCKKPAVDFSGNQICVDTNNIINATASDDSGIDNIEFFVDAASLGKNINFGFANPFTTVFAWDSTGKTPGTQIIFKAIAADLADNIVDKSRTTVLRPAHCCNGSKDGDETGTDCGGSCASCAGAACGVNLNDACAAEGDCSINNDKCSSGFCDCGGDAAACAAAGYQASVASCCLCQTKPVIYWVAPEGGFCRDAGSAPTNTPCQNDSECGGGTCDKDTPNGAEGNFATIGGRNFGGAAGKVYFQKNGGGEVEAALANTVNPNCVGAWQDDQIIVVVPATAASGFIKIVDVDNNEEATNDSFGPAVKDFTVNTIIRPGLCKLTLDNGKAKDKLVYDGIRLLGSTARFGKSSDFFDALSSDFTVGDLQGTAIVPYLQTGKTTTFVAKANIASNYINFTKNKEAETGLRIESFEPQEGKAGQYVTIYGSGFGKSRNGSKVYFGADEADYQFPDVCADSVWSDNQIIVKVPGGAADGDYIIKIEVNPVFADTSALTPAKFNINSALSLAPSLCKVKPIMGPNNSEITLWGEYFGTFNNPNSKVRFNLNHDQSGLLIPFGPLISWGPEGKADKIEALVHNEAITGPIRVVNDVLVGNGINFTVGNCAKDVDCGGGNVCCPTGTSKSGRCETEGADKYENCYEDLKSSVYEWEFSTAAKLACDGNILTPACEADDNFCLKHGYDFCDTANGCVCAKGTPAESCSGLSQGQCADAMCPNSPGKCSGYAGGNSKTVGDCSNAYCNNTYSSCSGNCEYDSGLNKCKLSEISCNSNDNINVKFDAESADALVKLPAQEIIIDDGSKVYSQAYNAQILSSDFIPVNTARQYALAGKFKSVGSGGPSRLYFGLAPYDASKNPIGSWQVYRNGSDATINNFTNAQIIVNEVINGWTDAGPAGQRSLGFYYNGDTTKLPDYVYYYYPGCSYPVSSNYYCTDANQGAYDGTSINGSQTITLNNPIPPAIAALIIPGTTKVKNHRSGGGYMYSATAGVLAPAAWTEYKAEDITGEMFNAPYNVFWPETKYVKILFLLNYQQNSSYKLLFDNITFSSLSECREVNGQGVWQINAGGVSCPSGTFLDTNKWCTVGTSGNPKTCALNACPGGFSCENEKCVVGKKICPSGSACDAGQCKTNDQPACECCCRIGYDAQDCCAPLKCEGECGSDRTDDQNQFGYCSGCASAGATTAQHDAACNCSGHSGKFCDTSIGDGVCRDCAELSNDSECNNHSAVCCIDAKNGMKCGGGDGTQILGGYCAYYSCNASAPYDCLGPDMTGIYKNDNTCKNQCKAPDVPGGDTCYNKDTDNCDLTCAIGYNCLGDNGCLDSNQTPPPPSCGAGNTTCLCCCNPANDQCGLINSKLTCSPDKDPCTSGFRGLCCGCSQDSECGDADTTGCGTDSCCRPRPAVESNYPADEEAGICRNPFITITFNEEMQTSSFNGNVIVAGDYEGGECPKDTQFLAGIDLSNKNFIAKFYHKIVYMIKKGLRKLAQADFIAKAYTPPAETHNYCAISGTVGNYLDSGRKSVLTFKPQKALDANRTYYVVIKGDENVNDAEAKGVLNINGIGMKGATASAKFNTLEFDNAHIWNFKTGDKICELSYITIDPSSYLFQKAGATKEFQAYPKSADDQNIVGIPGLYNWKWNWTTENKSVADVTNSDSDKQTVTSQKIKDGKTIITASAAITDDAVFSPSTKGKTKEGKANVYVLLCDNPWPPISETGDWQPWSDSDANCTITGDGCVNTNMEIYYCRDAGKPGTADDLPVILSGDNSVIRESSSEKNILKEIYLFRESLPSFSSNLGLNTNFETDLNVDGIGDPWGEYHLMPIRNLVSDAVQGNKAQRIVSEDAAHCGGGGTCGGISRGGVGGLIAGKSYTVSFYAKKGAMGPNNEKIICFSHQNGAGDESCLSFCMNLSNTWEKYSKTCILDIVKSTFYFWSYAPSEEFFLDDFQINEATTFNVADQKTGGIVVASWPAVSNVKGYKLYWGTASNNYSNSKDVGNVLSYAVENLTNNKTYYFNLTAYFNTGAESVYYGEVNIKPTDKTSPAVPANFLISSASDKGEFTFVWKANSEADLAGYKIYYGTSAGIYGASEKLDKVTEAKITGLIYGSKYYAALSAYDASGNESVKSAEITINEKTYRDLQRLADMLIYKNALEAFKKDKGRYPGELKDGITTSGIKLNDLDPGFAKFKEALEPYLSILPKDPLDDNNIYYYVYDPSHCSDKVIGSCACDAANGVALGFMKAETDFVKLNKDTCSGDDQHIDNSAYNLIFYPESP